jgi:hypothetical protein
MIHEPADPPRITILWPNRGRYRTGLHGRRPGRGLDRRVRYTRPFGLVIFQHGHRLIPAPVTGDYPIVTVQCSRHCLVCVTDEAH